MSTTTAKVDTAVKVAARLAFAKVHEGQGEPETDAKGKPYTKYSCALIISKDDKASMAIIENVLKDMEAGIKAANKGKLPPRWKSPIRDGDAEREGQPEYENAIWLNASTKTKPAIFKKVAGEVVEVKSEEEVYSGCYVKAKINFFTFDVDGNKGIGVGLLGLFKTKDGERLAGGGASASDFEDDDTEEDDML